MTAGQLYELNSKLAEMKKCSRWLSDSAQFTFFGRPPFHAYGNGNTDPTVGGGVYGQYMKTHNINPHAGGNRPKYCQVHQRALLGRPAQVGGPMTKKIKRGGSANWARAATAGAAKSGAGTIEDGVLKKMANPGQVQYIREVSKGKKPVKINRQPIPPRVPTGKYEMPEEEMREYEK